MTEAKLFKSKKDCCGCGACVNICAKNAVSMKEDEFGFIYPKTNSQLCVGYGMCQKVCSYQNKEETGTPLETWVAVSKDELILKNSSSGGIFTTFAIVFLENDGYISGAAFDEDFNLNHILTNHKDDLSKIQGSKYTHSSTGKVFREIKEKLKNYKVLFCGCPCQVAGLKSYLGSEYSNLITIDLICHGVPSNKSFKDYLSCVEIKKKCKIKNFKFRDKKWGLYGFGTILMDNNIEKKVISKNSSYYTLFQNGLIYRENCYSCKYANSHRTGDFTIGDYWGAEAVHPELFKNGIIDERKGVSVIIVNTENGRKFLKEKAFLFSLFPSDFAKAAKGNSQLNAPCILSPERNDILAIYSENGWDAVDKKFNSDLGLKKYCNLLKGFMPYNLKKTLKKILK